MSDNFFVSVLISYCQSEVIVFLFYQELNTIPSENSELSCKILHILLVFDKIVVYLHKIIVDLINISHGKSLYSANQNLKLHILPTLDERMYLHKRKKNHILKLSVTRNFDPKSQ